MPSPKLGYRSSPKRGTLQRKKEIRKEIYTTYVSLPEWFPEELWKKFVAHRKSIKAPIIQETTEDFIKKFDRLRQRGWPPSEVISHMIERGWRWFKPEWVENKEKGDEDGFAAFRRRHEEDVKNVGKKVE